MADELDDQAAMAQWASQTPPGAFDGGGDAGGGNEFGDFSGGMGGWDDGGGEAGSERILNQDEIDSLLGFDLSGDGGEDRTGIRAIINSALVSYERLPMLEIVFDLAIEGNGFFHVQAGGADRYTRDGRFTTNPEGQLVTQEGALVMDDGGGPLTIDPTLGPVAIGKDGTVSQGAVRVGRLAVVRPDDLSSMAKDGDNLYRNTANTTLAAAPDARVHQGMLESSNVQPVIEITKLIEIQRAYESVAKMMDNTAELSRTAVDRLGKVN